MILNKLIAILLYIISYFLLKNGIGIDGELWGKRIEKIRTIGAAILLVIGATALLLTNKPVF